MQDFGAANRYDFNNPSKWHTVYNVPLLDEHIMTNEDGRPVATVDKYALEKIANNNNKRVYETGDPATLILGHTSDDPQAPEKPAKGFVVNYRVRPYKKNQQGQVVYAIYGDYKIRPKNVDIIEEYPRRSVELWWNKKELDPIALLGGTSPERDLGVVIRNGRINHINLRGTQSYQKGLTGHAQTDNSPDLIKYSSRGNYLIEQYTIDERFYNNRKGKNMKYSIKNGRVKKYEQHCADDSDKYMDEDMDTMDIDNSSPSLTDDDNGNDIENDPLLAKIFQSKQWKSLESKLDMMLGVMEEAFGGGEEPPIEGDETNPGMNPPMTEGDESLPQEDGMGDESEDGMNPDEEDRISHGDRPVQFEQAPSTGMAGPMNTNIPKFQKMSRNGTKGSPMTKDQVRLAKLERQNEQLQLRLSRADAEKKVAMLKAEGIIFGDTPEDAAAGEADDTEFLSYMTAEEQDSHINNVIRKRYKRRKPNPASMGTPGVARYARADTRNGESIQEDGEFDPQDPQEASDYADLLTVKKMSKLDATKFMMKRRKERNGN